MVTGCNATGIACCVAHFSYSNAIEHGAVTTSFAKNNTRKVLL